MGKRFLTLIAVIFLWAAASLSPAQTQTATPGKAQYDADSKAALARYEADKKLCNDELSAAARLQCRRDAKSEYERALATARTQMSAASNGAQEPRAASCPDCGKVVAITVTEKEGEGSPVGLIAGGAAGALLGRQVGGGAGKDLATIAGAVGGAYAGKKLEERMKTHKLWTVSVRYDDGRTGNFEFSQDPALRVGDAVKNSGNSIVRR